MAHHFGRSPHPNSSSAKMILEPTINPFTGGALPDASARGFVQRTPIATFDRFDNGHLAQPPDVSVNRFGIVSRVHQLIERSYPLGAHLHQRNGHLRVVGAGTGQNGTNRDISINDIHVQLVTLPVFRLALRAFLATAVAGARQVGKILCQRAPGLKLQARRRLLRRLLPLFGPPDFAPLCRRYVAGSLAGCWPLRDLDRRRISTHMPDELGSTVLFDQRLMYLLRQLVSRKLRKGSAEG